MGALQTTSPSPLEEYAEYLEATMNAGISREEIRRMSVVNPAQLAG
jgi:hypothetical protein